MPLEDGGSGKRRALVVDDEQEIAEFVAEVLEMADLEVDYLTSVASARAHDLNQYQLVVLDLMMPTEDGASLLPELAACTPSPVVILMSGDIEDLMQQIADNARDQGLSILGCLRKPFFSSDIEQLLAAL